MLIAGAALAGSTTAGFALYGLLLVIIGLLSCLICPCAGAAVLGGTGVAWGMCIFIDVVAGLLTLAGVGACGVLGLAQVKSTPQESKGYVLTAGIAQVALGVVGAWLLLPLMLTLMQ